MPSLPEVPHTGFGYPLCGVSHLQTLETSFSPQRSWASPCKALLLSHDRITLSSDDSSALAFPYKTLPGLVPTLQRLTPMGKAVLLLLLPEGLIRTGAYCSLGLFDLLGPLSSPTHEISVSLIPSPSRTLKMKTSQLPPPGTPGMSDQRKAAFSPKGCRPIWPSPPTASATS